jgi:hypothetical protein
VYTYVHSHLQHFLFNKNFQVSLYNGYINDLPQYGKELPVLQMDQTVAKRYNQEMCTPFMLDKPNMWEMNKKFISIN